MRKLSAVLMGFAAAAALNAPAQAQVIPTPAVPNAVLALPPAQHKALTPPPTVQDNTALPDAAGPSIAMRSVDIEGAKVIPSALIARQFAGLAGKTSTAAQLQAALEAVNKLYTDAGYALGRAYIPAQQMKDGVLTVRVLEGYIGAVVVKTDTPRIKDNIARYAGRLLAEHPLRTADLDRYLRLISELPGLTVTAKLTDMNLQTGAAALELDVVYRPITTSVALNSGSDVRGMPVQPYLTVKANDLLGIGDQLSLVGLLSPIPKEEYYLQAGGSAALGNDGWRIASTSFIARAQANILPRTIDLTSSQMHTDLQASYPLIKSITEQLTMAGGSYFSRLNYDLDNAIIAKDRQVAVYTDLSDFRQVTPNLARTLGGRITLGLNLPYADGIPGTRANATQDYAKLDVNVALSYAFDTHFSVTVRADGQTATGSLSATEEVAYGGDRFGRGYDSGVISGDHGVGVSLQPQYSFALAPNWGASTFVFGDYARVFNTKGDGQADASLVSTGVGVGVSYGIYSATLGLAEPLQKIPGYNLGMRPRLFGGLQWKLN